MPWLPKTLREPIVADILRPRPLAWIVAGTGAAQLGVSAAFHWGFPCAFHATTGIPCPGCGLTRSVLAIFHGDLAGSFRLHPFGGPLLAGLLLALLLGVLPEHPRLRAIAAVKRIESSTGITMILLVIFMLVWVLRITGVVHLDTLA